MSLPKRWLDYLPMGRSIPGTKFLPFKVPLKKTSIECLKKDQWFTPAILLEQQPRLRAVIDLTDTLRYYNPQELTTNGIIYKKIRITGGGVIPSRQKLFEFFDTVDELLQKFRHDSDALIGVHCTHGLNRTGYLICKYMVRRLNIRPEKAISRFQDARGYEMTKELFVNDVLNNESFNNFETNPETKYKSREHYSKYTPEVESGREYFARPYTQNKSEWQYSGKRFSESESNWRYPTPRFSECESNWRQTTPRFSECESKWQHSGKRFSESDSKWQHSGKSFIENYSKWQHSGKRFAESDLKGQHSGNRFAEINSKLQSSRKRFSESESNWRHPTTRFSECESKWQHSGKRFSESDSRRQHSEKRFAGSHSNWQHSAKRFKKTKPASQHSSKPVIIENECKPPHLVNKFIEYQVRKHKSSPKAIDPCPISYKTRRYN